MSYSAGGGSQPSIAPPGWSPAAQPIPEAVSPSTASADAAVRWRIGAAVIDNFVVFGGYLSACVVLGWRVGSLSHLWALLAGSVIYHLLLEARDGQTLGKRRYGIRVVSVDGGEAAVPAVALRSLLRLVDQLPVCYVSGLVSMVRTGPERRQRIGDVVGGTKVVAVDGHAARSGTPEWLLPVATVVAVLISAATIYVAAETGNQTLSSTERTQFISGCETSPAGRFVSCSCLLDQLQAAGYNTINELRDLMASVQSPAVGGTLGGSRQVLVRAALSCRV